MLERINPFAVKEAEPEKREKVAGKLFEHICLLYKITRQNNPDRFSHPSTEDCYADLMQKYGLCRKQIDRIWDSVVTDFAQEIQRGELLLANIAAEKGNTEIQLSLRNQLLELDKRIPIFNTEQGQQFIDQTERMKSEFDKYSLSS
jgi:hypothetical protein